MTYCLGIHVEVLRYGYAAAYKVLVVQHLGVSLALEHAGLVAAHHLALDGPYLLTAVAPVAYLVEHQQGAAAHQLVVFFAGGTLAALVEVGFKLLFDFFF